MDISDARDLILKASQARGEVVINFILTKKLFEVAQPGIGINNCQFDSSNFGEIFQVLSCDSIAVARVVCTPGIDTRRTRSFEVGQTFPDGARYLQLR